MDKKTYFIEALNQRAYVKFKWILMCFLHYTPPKGYQYVPHDVVQGDTHYAVYDENMDLVEITDADISKPLLNWRDPITLKASTFINQPTQVDTTYGNVFFNAYTALYALKGKVPFQTGKVNLKKIELSITKKLVKNQQVDEFGEEPFDPNQDHYGHDEIPMVDKDMWLTCCGLLETLGKHVVVSATPKNTVPPKGIRAFMDKLSKEYGDNPTDIEQAEINRRIQAFDGDWLKGDPSLGGVMSGKAKSVARVKIHAAAGSETNFTPELEAQYNMSPLTDGVPTTPKEFATLMTSVRYGSYMRGIKTAVGGVISNILMGILVDIQIQKVDCGTKKTIEVMLVKQELHQWVGRYYKKGTAFVPLTQEEAENAVGKRFLFRTPGYCLEPKDRVCEVCGGVRATLAREGLGLLGAAIADVIIYYVFAKMKAVNKTSVVTEWDRVNR